MGATKSREAMRMPISQMQAVSSRDHVGSPLAFAWPKICEETNGGAFTVCSECRHVDVRRGGKGRRTDPEGGHDAVLGDGLHETRSSRQTLQPRPAGGEEGADHDHPR
ncbi:hypothetical protein EYF80_067334 [Liparis tanakae]|uniref:Uncharacterized protein n=1 Tax=Liparis tanakae TaxID=230148 RepID=A0A4Z2E2F0_9TELE|nr:hypothetical protein EYF80_067334 [Liparis tanakae]